MKKKKEQKNKNIIILAIILVLLVFFAFIFIFFNKKDKYEIKTKAIDEYSPDMELIVLNNGNEIKDYKYIKYKNGDVILCYSTNPHVNKYELEDELVIVMKDDKEVIAKVLKE